MPVFLEFYNVLVKREAIEKKCYGGWQEFISNSFIAAEWYDDYLFRTGAMNPMDVERIIDRLKEDGLNPTKLIDGEEHWDDMCVFASMFGPTLPCEWIDMEYHLKHGLSVNAIRMIGDENETVEGPKR